MCWFLCGVEIEFHAGRCIEKAKPISRPVLLAVGIEEPTGVVQIQVHLCGTSEKYQYEYSPMHTHTHTHTRLLHSFLSSCCFFPLAAGRNLACEIHE